MAEHLELAELYMQRHPREAVAVLEDIDPAAVAILLEELSDERAADVLTRLPPVDAAACVNELSVEAAARQLGNLPRRVAAAVLRQTAAARRDELLQAIPAATRMQLQVILHQPSHRVGAWIDTRIATIEKGTPALTARHRLSRVDVPAGAVYLVDDEQRLEGIVSVRRLLALPEDQPVEAAAMPARSVLRANGTTESALEDPAWDEVDSLPVVDHDGKLVGNIRHAALRRAAQQQQAAASSQASSDYLSLANSVYVGLAEVLATSMAKANTAGEKPR